MNILYFFTPGRVTNTLARGALSSPVAGSAAFPSSCLTFRPAVLAWLSFGFALVSEPYDPVVDVRLESPSVGPLTRCTALFQTAVVAHDAHAMADG
jgi:hypothetical protein